MSKSNGQTNLEANYAEIQKAYPHVNAEVAAALGNAVLAGLPEGDHPMSEIGPLVVEAFAWAEDIFCRSDILRAVMQEAVLIRVEKGGLRFEER